MEDEIKNKLQISCFKKTGKSSSGCISSGEVYATDNGSVFVKKNGKLGADIMFNGEFEGEAGNLGKSLALLHKEGKKNEPVTQFGFSTTTCCGFIPMDNSWSDDWVSFYARQRIEPHVKKLVAEHGERQLNEFWNQLHIKLPNFFKDVQVTPSLLHGDLWSGNTGQTENGPIAFDPAAFYGHDEFDLAIAKMWGGLPREFFDAYHSIIPKRPGYQERHNLYLLFHHLNHWSHFGSGYKDSSLRIMKTLISS